MDNTKVAEIVLKVNGEDVSRKMKELLRLQQKSSPNVGRAEYSDINNLSVGISS